jgi:hypothetical protein
VLVFANDRRGSISDSFASALAYWNPAFAMSIYSTNDSLASRWSQFGSIAPRSYVVEPGEQQLGAVLVLGIKSCNFFYVRLERPMPNLPGNTSGDSLQPHLHHGRVCWPCEPALRPDAKQSWYPHSLHRQNEDI